MRLEDHEVYRCIRAVDIQTVLPVVHKLEFRDTDTVSAWMTKPGSRCPAQLLKILDEITKGLGGNPRRMFCRKLLAHQSIPPHVDDHKWMRGTDIRRFQLPLISHPDIKMKWPEDGVELHLAPGYLYEVRFDRTHEVINNTDCERIHVQIDQHNAKI